MVNYGYINSSDDLVAYDTNNQNLTLSAVQVIVPSAATKVDNVPSGLLSKFSDDEIKDMLELTTFSRKTSGDGTDISHWTEINDSRTFGDNYTDEESLPKILEINDTATGSYTLKGTDNGKHVKIDS